MFLTGFCRICYKNIAAHIYISIETSQTFEMTDIFSSPELNGQKLASLGFQQTINGREVITFDKWQTEAPQDADKEVEKPKEEHGPPSNFQLYIGLHPSEWTNYFGVPQGIHITDPENNGQGVHSVTVTGPMIIEKLLYVPDLTFGVQWRDWYKADDETYVHMGPTAAFQARIGAYRKKEYIHKYSMTTQPIERQLNYTAWEIAGDILSGDIGSVNRAFSEMFENMDFSDTITSEKEIKKTIVPFWQTELKVGLSSAVYRADSTVSFFERADFGVTGTVSGYGEDVLLGLGLYTDISLMRIAAAKDIDIDIVAEGHARYNTMPGFSEPEQMMDESLMLDTSLGVSARVLFGL